MTALLIHGTGALDLALEKASEYATHYEYGGNSLATNDAREAIQKMSYPIVGVSQFAVVIGAVDKARGSATDALLKSIEEHDDFVVPILWANALMDVPNTIRSRCRVLWSNAEDPQIKEEFQRVAKFCVAGNYASLIMALNATEAKPVEVLMGVGNALSQFDFQKPRVSKLWNSVRLALRQDYVISKNELLGVLCV